MSRLGKVKIKVPANTKIIIKSRLCLIEGPFGILTQRLPKQISLQIHSTGITLNYSGLFTPTISSHLGLLATLLKNKLLGVHVQFEKKLELIGIGYRAKIDNNILFIVVGYSHPTFFPIPNILELTIINKTLISIKGLDKQAVCLFASKIRNLRVPEPYKGTGIKYKTELVVRKIGKSLKT